MAFGCPRGSQRTPRLDGTQNRPLPPSVRWLLFGRLSVALEATSGRYACTVRTSVLVEVNRGTVPTPPKFGRPMAVQRCAHWSSAGTRGVQVQNLTERLLAAEFDPESP
ncbi:hypothetical protein PCANC_12885 [Puccinia coronata f. sp. avenae]|uniref:Uncharacterized protein n=1 Tax=Puccinia coronata f. sp. avenae TaxID=200324 RepID=A0A2N5VEF2_9BASI|nr:hypothetical protein PCANC_12885 [Puccinia coronata f. sp. avenae]